MRYFTLALFLVLANTCHAGIFVFQNGPIPNNTVTIGEGVDSFGPRGQTFTNGSLAAQILSVTLFMKNPAGAGGTISMALFPTTGTPGSGALPTGPAVATSTVIFVDSRTIDTNLTPVKFSGFTGTNTTLAANTNYAFTVNILGTFPELSLYYGSQIANQNSYTTNPLAADLTNDIAGTVEVIVTPEPATIVLFGGAMIIGGAGAYLKRRKQKQANPG